MSICSPDLSPVSLSYTAALRGVKPRIPGTEFTYARVNMRDPQAFICLAASNPEGRFFGLLPDRIEIEKAKDIANARKVKNVEFIHSPPTELPLPQNLPLLDYLVWDETGQSLESSEREKLFAFAEKAAKPGGLLIGLYRAYDDTPQILRFLVNEFEPEMNQEQSKEFLHEIKALGETHFATNPAMLVALENAITADNPKMFFEACRLGEKNSSGTIEVMSGLLPRGFAFVGDADIGSNYMDLAVPVSAHETLESCRDHLLYEPIKDFAINRVVRHDIWVRLPIEQTDDPAVLFGRFTYGIMMHREEVPTFVKTAGRTIDLTQPLIARMIDLMTDLPMTIGDFLQHPLGQGKNPSEVLDAMHTLIAIGIAQPMRGHHKSQGAIRLSDLKWASDFNKYLNDMPIENAKVILASEVAGRGISVPARDALAMQAINRAGLADSASALLIELLRLTSNPSSAATIMDVAEPTPELAENIMQDVIRRSMIKWYSYGLLAA